jgi:transcriptional regulator
VADTPLLPGTLDVMLLQVLADAPLHGWGISEAIRERSRDAFRINQGSLYVAIERMLRRGWVTSAWRITDSNRRARYYTITTSGRRRLEKERRRWERTAAAVSFVLKPHGGR